MRTCVTFTLLCAALFGQSPVQPTPSPDAPAPAVKPEDKCSIEGTVVNSLTGEPLKGAHLSLRLLGASNNGAAYGTVTDAAGHYLINDVDPGRYSFSASRNRFVIQPYSPKGDAKRNTTITLGNGQHLTDVTFNLSPQGVISGRILDGEGEPLQGVQVQTMRYSYQRGMRQLTPRGASTTNDLGEFRIYGLSPGKYVVSAMNREQDMYIGPNERMVGSSKAIQATEEGYAVTYYPNTANPDAASQIEVAAGTQIQGVNMTLVRTRTVRIKGQVITGLADTSMARRTNLMLIPRQSGIFSYLPRSFARVIDGKGSFEMRGVSPGSYLISADVMDGSERYSARVQIEVGDTNMDGIEVRLQPPSEISGRLVIEENADLKGNSPSVYLEPKAVETSNRMGGQNAQVKDDLTFKLTLSPDPYDVNMFGLPDGFFIKAIRMGGQDVTLTGLDFTRGVVKDELTVVLNPNGAQLEGTVRNAKAENAPGATVTLIPDAEHRGVQRLYKVANADQNGHFSLKSIPPGEYLLLAWEDIESGAYQDPDFVKPHESQGQSISVKQGDRQTLQLKAVPAEDTGAAKASQ